MRVAAVEIPLFSPRPWNPCFVPVPENAETGWAVYRHSDYEMTLGDINAELSSRGLGPVSPRMYTHYRKLHRYGFEQYIPINQLDVKTMEDPVWDRASRGRYVLQPVEEAVRVVLLREDRPVTLDGLVEQLSDGELVIRLLGAEAIDTFDGRSIWTLEVAFQTTGDIRLCEVVRSTVDRRRQRVTLRATFARIAALDELLTDEAMLTRTVRVVVGTDPRSPLLGRTTQQLYWLFSTSEALRLATNEILISGEVRRRTVPSNRVDRLQVGSPLEAVLVVAVPVALSLGQLLKQVVGTRKDWWDGQKSKQESYVAQEEVAGCSAFAGSATGEKQSRL